jgi:hypothetical protein
MPLSSIALFFGLLGIRLLRPRRRQLLYHISSGKGNVLSASRFRREKGGRANVQTGVFFTLVFMDASFCSPCGFMDASFCSPCGRRLAKSSTSFHRSDQSLIGAYRSTVQSEY